MNLLSRQKRRNVLDRISVICSNCFERLQTLITEDTAKKFFEGVETLFHPPKVMSLHCNDVISESVIKKAKDAIIIFRDISLSQFLVMYAIFTNEMKDALTRSCDFKVDLVSEVLYGMLATNFTFALQCLQIIHCSVSNVDAERTFSAYSDIVTPKR